MIFQHISCIIPSQQIKRDRKEPHVMNNTLDKSNCRLISDTQKKHPKFCLVICFPQMSTSPERPSALGIPLLSLTLPGVQGIENQFGRLGPVRWPSDYTSNMCGSNHYMTGSEYIYFCLVQVLFLFFFLVPLALYLLQFGMVTLHFAQYLLHFGMVTLHFAWHLLHLAMFAFDFARYLPRFGTSTSHLHGICYMLVLQTFMCFFCTVFWGIL